MVPHLRNPHQKKKTDFSMLKLTDEFFSKKIHGLCSQHSKCCKTLGNKEQRKRFSNGFASSFPHTMPKINARLYSSKKR